MKKILVIALVLISSVTFAQQTDSAFQKDAEKLIAIVSGGTFDVMLNQLKGLVPEDKKEAFLGEVKETLPALYGKMAKIYMEEFTHSEIKELLKFYETPVGKKMAEKTGILTQKGMLAGQEWGLGLQSIIQKYQ